MILLLEEEEGTTGRFSDGGGLLRFVAVAVLIDICSGDLGGGGVRTRSPIAGLNVGGAQTARQ